ncbi:hypothetical protein APHAL10511_007678 [Amanita phalloides]|nr:hypothetical protein APHAL10511_007678 [Amanita phalloides]
MESLLTPSESLVFQSFLSSIDSPAPDWVFYSPVANDPPDFSVPQAQGREALAKATKDLMSLDAGRWHPTVAASHHPRRPQQYHHPYNSQRHQPLRPQIGGQQQHHASISHDPFPFLHANKHPQYQRPVHQRVGHDPSAQPQHPHHLVMPSGADGHHLRSGDSPTSAATPSAATTPITTTSTPHHALGSSSTMTEARSPRPSKRQQLPSSLSSAAQKQNLLSPSQKKANHIQSEQKRRANIRKGYDALCETVPALREGIKEEEEREAEARMNAGARVNGSTGRSKKGKKKEGDDKADGRAGPRSENVVLSKTIDYINELLSERQGLLSRLQHARSILPPSHPALVPPVQHQLWEREWKGGEGKYDAKADEEEEEEESS